MGLLSFLSRGDVLVSCRILVGETEINGEIIENSEGIPVPFVDYCFLMTHYLTRMFSNLGFPIDPRYTDLSVALAFDIKELAKSDLSKEAIFEVPRHNRVAPYSKLGYNNALLEKDSSWKFVVEYKKAHDDSNYIYVALPLTAPVENIVYSVFVVIHLIVKKFPQRVKTVRNIISTYSKSIMELCESGTPLANPVIQEALSYTSVLEHVDLKK